MEKKAIKWCQITNEVCYEVLDQAGKNQMLVFVHSRKETAKTARFLRDTAIKKETITQSVKPGDSAVQEILTEEAGNMKDSNLKDLWPFGLAIHHAGMSREDHGFVEELFADGSIQVLVCTATLAWGVNLPAHTVIIKGTQIYNQRRVAGRSSHPKTSSRCSAAPVIHNMTLLERVSNHSDMQYYLGLLNPAH